MKYKLNKHHCKHSNGSGYITGDGHTMFQQDIVKELNRVPFLEKQFNNFIEQEALCCPEDMGFKEYIEYLETRVAILESKIRGVCTLCTGDDESNDPTGQKCVECINSDDYCNFKEK